MDAHHAMAHEHAMRAPKPPKWRVGDIVRCVDVGTLIGLLELDKLYRVVEVKGSLLKLDGAGQSYFSSDHFRLEVRS